MSNTLHISTGLKRKSSRVDGSPEQAQMLRNTINRATKPTCAEDEVLILFFFSCRQQSNSPREKRSCWTYTCPQAFYMVLCCDATIGASSHGSESTCERSDIFHTRSDMFQDIRAPFHTPTLCGGLTAGSLRPQSPRIQI